MASPGAIRSALANNLRTVSGLVVSATVPSEITNARHAVVEFAGAPEIRQAMGKGLVELEYVVHVFVPDNGDPGDAESRLDDLLNTGSGAVFAAIESDVTLDGTADHCVVTGYGPYEWVTVDGSNARHIKGSVNVTVRASGV